MSLGYGGVAKLIIDDGSVTEYLYGSFNFNLGVDEKNINYDGIISIDNDCFYEPEIHSKTTKMPSGKRSNLFFHHEL